MDKKLFLTLGCLFWLINVHCQEVKNNKIKIFTSINPVLSQVNNEYKYLGWGTSTDKENSQLGLSTMLGIEFQLNNYFSIQTGFQYSFRWSSLTLAVNDTFYSNWKDTPRKYNSETKYQFISFPLNLKCYYFQTTKIKSYIKCGLLLNVIKKFENNVQQTFYDGSLKKLNLSPAISEFKKPNFSISTGAGFEYDLSQKLYLNIDLHYNYMINSMTSEQSNNNSNHYNFSINDFGIGLSLGLKL